MKEDQLQFGEDYYFNEDGFMVFTAAYLLKRGFCCQSGCRHCPYGFPKSEEESLLNEAAPAESKESNR